MSARRAADGPRVPLARGVLLMLRVIRISSSSRAGAVALAAGIVVVGGTLLVVGATLLLALGAIGAVVGTGAVLLRRLTGGRRPAEPPPVRARVGLDPRLEVFPADVGADDADRRRLPPSA